MVKKSDVKVSDIVEQKTKGYKERLGFNAGGLIIDAEIRYQRIDASKILKQRFEVVRKDKKGLSVKGSYVDSETQVIRPRSLVYQNEKGEVVNKEETQEYLIDKQKGSCEEIAKTRFLKFVKVVPRETMDLWLTEDEFEVWSEDNSHGLLEIAKALDTKQEVAVYRFSNGTVYNAFIYPAWVNGSKFILIMKTTRIKKLENLKNLMEVTQAQQVRHLVTADMVEEI